MRLYVLIAEAVFGVAVLYFAMTRLIAPILFGRPLLKSRKLYEVERNIESAEEIIERERLKHTLLEKSAEAAKLRRANDQMQQICPWCGISEHVYHVSSTDEDCPPWYCVMCGKSFFVKEQKQKAEQTKENSPNESE